MTYQLPFFLNALCGFFKHWPLAVVCVCLFLPLAGANESTENCRTFKAYTAIEAFNFRLVDTPFSGLPKDLSVGEIKVRRFNVFNTEDPEEDKFIYRWANKLHFVTRESIIRKQLLFEEGEAFSLRRLKESERILRANPFLYDVAIIPVRLCGTTLDIEIITRDVWTTTAGVGFTRAGGDNTSTLSLTDLNFLGYGWALSLAQNNNAERNGLRVAFSDPHFIFPNTRLTLSTTDNSDGSRDTISYRLPFQSTLSNHSFSISYVIDDREDSNYFRDREVETFLHETQQGRISIGHRFAGKESKAHRLFYGVNYERHRFEPLLDGITPEFVPDNRQYSYPFVGYQFLSYENITAQRFTGLAVREDVFIGERFTFQLGYSSPTFEAYKEQYFASFSLNSAYNMFGNHWVFHRLGASGFWGSELKEWENLQSRYEVRAVFDAFANNQWLAKLRLNYVKNLTADGQLLLGGGNGLRGYPSNYHEGDRSALFSLEHRHFFDYHIYNLFFVGGAIFVDAGRAWFNDKFEGRQADNEHTLVNLGVGLRFTSSRFRTDEILVIDFAVPLKKDDTIDDFQFLIKGEKRF